MTEQQKDALIAACQAHGAIQSALGACAEADRLVRLAMIHAEQVTGIAAYARSVYDHADQALERSWTALRGLQSEIGDLIAELERGHQPQEPQEPQDYSI